MAFPDSSEVAQAIENAPDAAPESASGGDLAPENAAPTEQQLTELERLEKFKFDGQEYTPQELKKAILRQADYTRKTQEFSQERRYYDNLKADLRSVRANPALASEFRRVYPQKFHDYLEDIVASTGTPSAPKPETMGNQTPYAQLDPQLISRFEKLENTYFEKEVQAIETSLEAQEKEFSTKYPMADLENVYSKAQALLDRNGSLPQDEQIKLTKDLWDRIYKADHEKNKLRYESYYKENINKQKQAGLKGRDAGAGGGMPSGAPKTFKTIKEATNAALADLDS